MSDLALTIPEELVERIAHRAAELVTEHQDSNGDGWLRGADAIADYIGAPRSRVYALATCSPPRIPVEHDGSSLLAKRSVLDHWIESGGGRRP